jgi:choline dehydrogenase
VLVRAGRATGVELADGTVLEAGEVVVSAGTVQDPLLLWRSGIGAARTLRVFRDAVPEVVADLPAVGRHVSDHYVVTAAFEITPAAAPDDAPSLMTIAQTASGPDRTNDLQLTPFTRRHADGRRSLAMSVSLQVPDGEGEVVLAPDRLDGPPDISWPFTAAPSNVARLREGWRLAAVIARGSGVLTAAGDDDARQVLDATDADLDERVLREHSAFYHGVGSCRMGEDDEAVVDTSLRVRGVEGLHVVDASVIPRVPRAGTNLAAMAVAQRFAELGSGATDAGSSGGT